TTTLAAILALLYFGMGRVPSSRPGVGQAAPEFTLPGLDGAAHSLADYLGEVVVLEWTDYSSPFVEKHYQSGNLPQLQDEYAAKDVIWLSVATGKTADIEKLKKHPFAALTKVSATLLDASGEVARSYGARTTPHLFIIDREGLLAYSGAIDSIRSSKIADIERAESYLAAALNAVTAGREVADPVTRPYGTPLRY
ncbi:MAG: redoxin domain-containing protein, partial [Verrucomicrobiales bacterium]